MKKRLLCIALALTLALASLPWSLAMEESQQSLLGKGNGALIAHTAFQPASSQSGGPSEWARVQVAQGLSLGLVPAAMQSNYQQAATRAEFASLAVALYETLNGTISGNLPSFSDTSDMNVRKAAHIGVVQGVGDNRFNPDAPLTREQAAVMLSRLSDALGKPFAGREPAFSDNSSISQWAIDGVGRVQAAGIMQGVGDNSFNPIGSYTREQSIITIVRTYDSVADVPSIIPQGNNGTANSPFLVYDVETLRKVGTGDDGWTLAAHYKMTADVTLPSVSAGQSNWVPIGDDTNPFTGSFDGDIYAISNLTIDRPTADYQAMFGYVGNAGVVKNVTLQGGSITGSLIVGGVVGYNDRGTVEYCKNSASVTGNNNVGGVVGDSNGGTVRNCSNNGNVTGTNYGIGGVMGINTGTVAYCKNSASVTGYENVGGVVGFNVVTVEYCENTGSITGYPVVGGVVGMNDGTVAYCKNSASVTGSDSVGGVVGYNYNEIHYCDARNMQVTATYTGAAYVGRIVGFHTVFYYDGGGYALLNNTAWNVDVYSAGSPVTPISDPNGMHGADSP